MMLLIIMMNVNGWMDRLFSELDIDLGTRLGLVDDGGCCFVS